MVAGFCRSDSVWQGVPETAAPCAQSINAQGIKMMDLLTNRFYTGVVRGMAGLRLEIQMPLAARWQPGQRVRFALEEDGRIVSRRDMQRAIITHVEAAPGAGLHMNLTAMEVMGAV